MYMMKVIQKRVCAQNYISTFLLSLGIYLCWLTINPQGYHPPSSQCSSTDMMYIIRPVVSVPALT